MPVPPSQLGVQVVATNGLWDTAAGTVVELGDNPTTVAFLGFVHFGFPFVGTRILGW